MDIPFIYHGYPSNDIPCIFMDIPGIYLVTVDMHGISIVRTIDIPCISTRLDIKGIFMDIHVYPMYIGQDGIYMEYTLYIPGIYRKSGFQMSLQIRSFSEDRGKCNKTGNPSISDFSTILTSNILILADSSRLSSDEAYRQRMSLPCYRLSTPCYERKPNARHFSTKFSLKRDSARGECVFSVT